MQLFAQLFTQLDQTNKTNAKVGALKEYFDKASEADKIWAIALFSHKRPRRAVNSSRLREWASEAADLPLWLFEESYHVVGDLAETIALLLPAAQQSSERKLAGWMEWVIALRELDETEKKQEVLQAWQQLEARERFVFNKLLTGGFRVGVSQKLMVRALSQHTQIEKNIIFHRLMGNWEPQETSYQELLFSDHEEARKSRPYPFFLAHPLEGEAAELGPPEAWLAEWKWDGIRSQTIKRAGAWHLWSRGEELITPKFPDLEPLGSKLPDGTAIDGELLAWQDATPLPFSLLQTRIGRKNLSKKILEKAPAHIIAYDLMEWEGEDIRHLPLSERRALLRQLVEQLAIPEQISLSEAVEFDNWEQLAELREHARDYHSEGFMVKKQDSVYEVGRKRGNWWKWKVDPLTIDGVMIYAQRGHGRRANLYTDYTFAVWKDEETLVPFAKAYSGLTDQEINQVDRWVKRNTRERFGPVRSVVPELVFEIGFEGIQRSSRHKSGVALRFPRILRWRTDKKAEEADRLKSLLSMLERYGS
jgi:DNA ligase-1